jgi:hypothetical protein
VSLSLSEYPSPSLFKLPVSLRVPLTRPGPESVIGGDGPVTKSQSESLAYLKPGP